jgi:hypothetical protein
MVQQAPDTVTPDGHIQRLDAMRILQRESRGTWLRLRAAHPLPLDQENVPLNDGNEVQGARPSLAYELAIAAPSWLPAEFAALRQ